MLPRDNHISMLLVRQYHERVHHRLPLDAQCVTDTKGVATRYLCLPEFILCQKPAFTYVGVDFPGPPYIPEPNCSTTWKVYILLFTCCSTMAVYLEPATEFSADVFVRCLQRFTTRRGLPEIIFSGNAKKFKDAPKVSRKAFSYPSVKRFLSLPIEELPGALTWTKEKICLYLNLLEIERLH